jgi:uncharacterized protein YjbI with pentapeptide repeats
MSKSERQGILELVALGKSLSNSEYSHAELAGANLRGADLRGTNLSWANLARADLRGADLRGANLSRSNLSGALLSRADLYQAELQKTDLSNADLSRANFERARLTAADLRQAHIEGANLTLASLTWADLSRANLSRSDLSHADLRYSRFSEVNLTGAILDNVKVYGSAVFANRAFGIACRSLDISPEGDDSQILTDEPERFFGKQHHHNVRLAVEAVLDHQTNAILGLLYLQMAQQYPHLGLQPPTVEPCGRHTHITFEVHRHQCLGECARIACLPFVQTRQLGWEELVQMCEGESIGLLESAQDASFEQRLSPFLELARHLVGSAQLPAFFAAAVSLELFWGDSFRALRVEPGRPPYWNEPDLWNWMVRRSLG